MKNARPSKKAESSAPEQGEFIPNPQRAKPFRGTSNPRYLRVIDALLRRSLPRETLDRVAGCSNGPDLISNLNKLGLDIKCTRIDAFDRDGRPCRPGVYCLTTADRRKILRWLRERNAVVQRDP